MRSFAIVRAVPDSFPRALSVHPPPEPIDVVRAREQHASYVEALRELGLDVIVLDADEAYPDGCFVEDAAVVAGGIALATRPGAETRRGEVEAVRGALAEHMPVLDTTAPATLEGGDCMLVGDELFVGLSSRTNTSGVARAREVFEPRGVQVRQVAVNDGLHLKSSCSPLGADAVLAVAGAFVPATFGAARIVEVARDEAPAANVVCVGDRALVPAGFPRTADLLRRAGIEPVPVDNSELRKADSALTCLSVIADRPAT